MHSKRYSMNHCCPINFNVVILAKASIQSVSNEYWIAASAAMTKYRITQFKSPIYYFATLRQCKRG